MVLNFWTISINGGTNTIVKMALWHWTPFTWMTDKNNWTSSLYNLDPFLLAILLQESSMISPFNSKCLETSLVRNSEPASLLNHVIFASSQPSYLLLEILLLLTEQSPMRLMVLMALMVLLCSRIQTTLSPPTAVLLLILRSFVAMTDKTKPATISPLWISSIQLNYRLFALRLIAPSVPAIKPATVLHRYIPYSREWDWLPSMPSSTLTRIIFLYSTSNVRL